MKKLLALAFVLWSTAALAQGITNHAVPIGKGQNVSGWTASVPGAVGSVLMSTGASSDPTWQFTSGSGTVTSVALSMPNIFSVSGSPITGAGTLTATLATQTANKVFASAVSGGAATPAFRALVSADIPTIPLATGVSGNLPVANLGSGTSASAATFWRGDGTWSSTLGAAGNGGSLTLSGNTSGSAVISVAAIAGTVTFQLPSSNGTNGQCLSTNGSGVTSWAACGGSGITIDTTTITGGTTGRVLYNNAGAVGELTITGSGSAVLASSPTLTTPTLGSALATSINGLTLTSSTGTLTIANGKTATVSNTLTFTGTDSASVAFGSGGTVVYTTVTSLASLATVGTIGTGVWQGTKVDLAYGGTNADLSATGGASQVLKQATTGAAITVGTLACSDLSNDGTACSTNIGTSGATIPLLNAGNAWSGNQSFASGTLILNGTTSGGIILTAADVAGNNTIKLPAGTTDFSATGGTSQVVKQVGAGAAFTVARLACADLSDASSGCSGSVNLTIGTSAITGGTDGRILYDNAGVLGEKTITGTGDVVLASSPSLASPTVGSNGGTNGQITYAGSTSGTLVTKVNATAGTGIIFQFPNTNGNSSDCLVTNGAGVTSWSGVCSGGGGSGVTSITAGFGLTGGIITTSGTITAPLIASSSHAGLGGL